MPIFRFKRVTTIEHEITVYADNAIKAYAKASVGGLSRLREKEGVEVSDGVERTETVRVDDDSD